MEKSDGKNISDVLSLIEKQSLNQNINHDNKYNFVFKDINSTNFSYINGLAYVIIKCNLKFIKTNYNNSVPFLTDITFPSVLKDIYVEVCKKYFDIKDNYLSIIDNTFGNKKDGLVLFPTIKLNNGNLIQCGEGKYKLTLQFGSVLNKKYFDKICEERQSRHLKLTFTQKILRK